MKKSALFPASSKSVIVISLARAKALIDEVPNGLLFAMEYELKHPKCGACGHKSVKFQRGLDVCPKCGGKVLRIRVTLAQKGVENPSNVTPPGQGAFAGISAHQAKVQYNLFKHFDRNAVNPDGSRGGYRCGL